MPRRGWRGPSYEGEFPTLGWGVLAWGHAYLPSPDDEKLPLVLTDEQARIVLRWYEVDPENGEFPHQVLILEEAKGWGKSPLAGFLDLTEFAGPVCFDGWNANGEPVGVPWGTGGRPPPWVQIAAVSEDQTENTYGSLYGLLTANEHRAARELGIDDGRTRLFLKGRPGRLEPVTASAGSREGQRIVKATGDELWLWTQRNGGIRLWRTLLRNLTKMNGRFVGTTNAPLIGEGSVAEKYDPAAPVPGVLHFARRPKVEPDPAWPRRKLLAAINATYGDAHWVPRRRVLADVVNPQTPWDESLRFFFNIRTPGAGRAVDPRTWDNLARPGGPPPAGTYIGLGFDGSISQDATGLRGCTAEGYSFLIQAWERPTGAELQRWLAEHPGHTDWRVIRSEVHEAVARAFATWKVGRMHADPPKWESELEQWAALYGDEIVLAFDTNQYVKMVPAVRRWRTGITEGTHTHDGDPVTDAHVKAAHLRKVRVHEPEDDGRTKYVLIKGSDGRHIDLAIADVLAFEAAMSMPPQPSPPPAPFVVFGRPR